MRIPFLVAVALTTALPAQRELLDELPPDGEAWNYRVVEFGPEFEAVALPGAGEPKGLARIGDHVWFARGDRLLRLSWPACAVEVDLEAPVGLRSLCAGERFLYGLGSDGLLVLDPIAGRTVDTVRLEITDERRKDAKPEVLVPERIAARVAPGKLVVSTAFWWFEVDAGTGTGVRLGRLPEAQWLAHDGTMCWWGSQEGLNRLLTEEPAASGRFETPRWPWPLRASAGTWIDGRLLLAAERGDPGNEGVLVCGLLAVDVNAPAPLQLSVDVYWEAANKRKWVIGPKPLYSLQACRMEFVRLAQDPKMMVKRPDGSRGPMPVLVHAHPKVKNADVTAIWDAAAAAGFSEIRCPPIEAWVLAERKRKAAAEAKKK